MCSPSKRRRCRPSRASPGPGREAGTSPRPQRPRARGSPPRGPPSTWTTSWRRTAASTSWRRRTRSGDPARVSASMWNILRGKEIIFIGDLAANNRDGAEYFLNRGVFDPKMSVFNRCKSKSRISLEETDKLRNPLKELRLCPLLSLGARIIFGQVLVLGELPEYWTLKQYGVWTK